TEDRAAQLSSVPLSGSHDRLMCVCLHDRAATRLAQVDAVQEEAAYSLARPVRVPCGWPNLQVMQVVGERSVGRTDSAPAEDLSNRGSRRLNSLQPAAFVALVPRWNPRCDMHASPHRLALRGVPACADAFQLKLSDQGENSDRETAHRRRPIEVVLHRHQPSTRVIQSSDRLKCINRRPCETVKARNDHPARLTRLAPR